MPTAIAKFLLDISHYVLNCRYYYYRTRTFIRSDAPAGLVYISAYHSLGETLRIIRKYKSPHRLFFIPSRAIQSAVKAHILGKKSYKDAVILEYENIDAKIDAKIFAISRKVAEICCDGFFSNYTTKFTDDPTLSVIAPAVCIALSDRVATTVRAEEVLLRALDSWPKPQSPSVIFVASSRNTDRLVLAVLARKWEVLIDFRWIRRLRLQKIYPESILDQASERLDDQLRRSSLWTLELELPQRPAVLCCANILDRQYASTVGPIIDASSILGHETLLVPALATNRHAVVQFAEQMVSAEAAAGLSFGSHSRDVSERVVNPDVVAAAKATLAHMRERWRDEFGSRKHETAMLAAVTAMPSLVESALRYRSEFDRVRDRLTAVVVSPGRYLLAGTLTALANQAGIPTYEIQGGVIAATNWFVQPLARVVYAIDKASKRIYTDFLACDPAHVLVTGSPRIDRQLAPYRAVDRRDARADLGIGLADRDFVVLVATQPAGIEIMERMIGMVLESASSIPDAKVVVKPHPNEGPAYTELYTRLMQSKRLAILLPHGNIYRCIIAANVVVTYFSTVGIEASALGRKVVSIRIGSDPLPFDLAEAGFAEPATSEAELLAIFQSAQQYGEVSAAAQTASPLFSGGSAARIAADIANTAARRRSP